MKKFKIKKLFYKKIKKKINQRKYINGLKDKIHIRKKLKFETILKNKF